MADLYEMSDEELEAAFLAAKEAGEKPAADDDNVVEDEVEADEEYDYDEIDEEPAEDSEDEVEDDVDEEPEDLPNDDEDSDDNETDEDAEDEADEDSEQDEDKSEPEEAKVEAEVKAAMRKFKANGVEYEFSEQEIMEQFPRIFGQAMDYTKKTQALKPWRKTIDAIETAKMSHEDINLAIDMLRGDKSAIQEVLRRTGIDSLDLDTENDSKYVPKDYGRDEATLAIQDVIDSIADDPEYAITNRVLAKEWDDASWATMTKNPELIRLLHTDVKSGVFQQLQPIASKLKLYDRGMKSDIEYYEDAARQAYRERQAEAERQNVLARQEQERKEAEAERERIAEVKSKQKKAKAIETEAKARKAAAPVRKKAGPKKTVDYLDDSDEAYEEWYQSLQDRS